MSNEVEAQSGSPTDVGARLRAAREAKQITLREIADITKISMGALEALEQNDVARLPGGIFTRAFVRAYAAQVGLDPEQTLHDFLAQVPAEGSAGSATVVTRSPEYDLFQSQQRMAGTVLKLALVGVPVAGVLLFFGTRGVPTATETPVGAVEPAPPAPVRPDPPVSAQTPIRADPVPQGSLTIVLRPRDDCWVSLTLDGESVFTRVMRAGERESFEAEEEILLNIGDAGAFEFAINQQVGRSLGQAGEVVTARITHENYRSYVAP